MPDLIQPVSDALGLIAMSIVTKYLLLHLRLIGKPMLQYCIPDDDPFLR